MRGVAILLVIASHALGLGRGDTRFSPLGSAGVTLFFVLSGFLITSLLVEEQMRTGRLDLRRFYWRRAVRLGPALIVIVLFTSSIGGLLGSGRPPLLPVICYVANWVQASSGGMGILGHTWSLSIEEQFYVLWPAALAVTMRWRRVQVALVIGGIVASTILRFVVAGGLHASMRAYYGSDTEAASLLLGCLLALLAHRGLRAWKVPTWMVSGAVVASALTFFVSGPTASTVIVPTVAAPLGATLIWACCCNPGGVLAGRPLTYLGSRSYGLYLWNYIVLAVAVGRGRTVVGIAAGLAVTFVLAEVSWRLVERPIQSRFRQVPDVVRALPRLTGGFPVWRPTFSVGADLQTKAVAVPPSR